MFCSQNPQRAAEFWAAVLDRRLASDNRGILLPGESGQIGLRFAAGASHGEEMNRLHLHLADGPREQQDTIALCVQLGARLRGSGHVPENSFAAMADVVGDEFCVIEDRNTYLAGCGPLGEVTCEGTRSVGLFWSQALGWPLVWDHGEETAIQSTDGGTKVAWSGEAAPPGTVPQRQYFVLNVPSDHLDDEVERLTALGATDQPSSKPDERILTDPDGYKFIVRAVSTR